MEAVRIFITASEFFTEEDSNITELHNRADGEVWIGRQMPQRVAVMDIVIIPDAASRRISNSGDTDLVLLCICTPRFEPEKYRQLTTAG